VGARLTVARAAAREHLSYDLGPFGLPAGLSLLAASRLLRSGGRRSLGWNLLLKAHNRALSPFIDRQVVQALASSIALERDGQATGLGEFFDSVIAAAVSAYYGNPNRNPDRYIGSRILVVKSATPAERGVIAVDYQYVFPLFAGLFDVAAICDRYDVVLEPSWADVCAPEVLLFTRQRRPIYVQTIEPRDHAVLSALDTNLRVVPLAANWWVDPRRAPPSSGHRDIDVIMVAAWADIKRHWRVFRALSELRRRGRRLRTALVGYRYDRTRQEIEDIAAHFGIRDQIETYERIDQDEVSALLARSKVHVLWSRRECANRAIIEAMMADVPVIVREGLTFGYRYPYINEHTGRFVAESGLADAIVEMIDSREQFSPREWILEHMTCVHATRELEQYLQKAREERGESWSGGLVVRTSTLNTQLYFNPGDRRLFDADYAFLESTIRRT
jgi:glycosyltransferase involved in cell wall biosynthesis